MRSLTLTDTLEFGPRATYRVLPNSGRAGVMVIVATGLACYLAQWVGVALRVAPAQIATVWITGGLMLGIAFVTEPRRWPAVISVAGGGMALLLMTRRLVPPAAAILLGALASVHTVALAGVVRSTLGPRFVFATLREFLIYLFITAIGGAVVASSLLLAVSWGTGIRPATFLVWPTFALSAVLGYLTMTPMVVLLVRRAHAFRQVAPRRWLEAGVLALFLALALGLAFSRVVNPGATWAGFAITLPALLLWSAMRFGTLGAGASVLLVSVISTLGTDRGLGPFASESPGNDALALQLFILGTGVPLLGLAVVLSEQQRTRAALDSSDLRLRGLDRELIATREEQATHIARELHDDVGQRLALLSIGLSRLRKTRADGDAGHVLEIARLQEQTSAIASTLRQISHQLYPPALEHVGLASALQSTCEEVRQASGLEVRLVNHGDTSDVPRDVALCLFRVAQETLSNAVRHSGARTVDLQLRREGAELLLQVADDGRGFKRGTLEHGRGLGLRSAAERVRAVGGALTVESEPGAGTTVRMTVSLRGHS